MTTLFPFADYLLLPYQKPNRMTLDDFFEFVSKHYQDELPFVAYRKPNDTLLKAILQKDSQRYLTNNFTESGFVFAPFDSNQDAFLIPTSNAHEISVKIDENDISEVKFSSQRESENVVTPNETDKSAHIKQVEHGIDAIKTGVFSKVVLSRRESIALKATDPIEIFKRLLQRYPTAFVYCWFHPKVGLWLGATPETLISVRGNQLKTMSLAGTQAFEGMTDVIWKEKEKEEQQIVTDFIVESLLNAVDTNQKTSSNESSGHLKDLKVSGPNTVKAGNLLHLCTEISMRLKPETKTLKPILEALHPTPAVCGFPKEKAKAFIIENEGYPREFYSGFLGELNLNETISRNNNRRNVENNAYSIQKKVSNLYVNLRCMQLKDLNIFIYVGGGITKDSNAEAEWVETVHKSQVIKSVL